MKNKDILKNNNTYSKRKYSKPEINFIKIDKDVSILMSSSNPYHDPDEESFNSSKLFNNPFKISKA